jgi:hypothetical protein
MTRQPLATWHTCPPVAVATHSRLQQFVPLSQLCPSMLQLPEPVPFSSPQVPAVLPDATLQIPLQQVEPA